MEARSKRRKTADDPQLNEMDFEGAGALLGPPPPVKRFLTADDQRRQEDTYLDIELEATNPNRPVFAFPPFPPPFPAHPTHGNGSEPVFPVVPAVAGVGGGTFSERLKAIRRAATGPFSPSSESSRSTYSSNQFSPSTVRSIMGGGGGGGGAGAAVADDGPGSPSVSGSDDESRRSSRRRKRSIQDESENHSGDNCVLCNYAGMEMNSEHMPAFRTMVNTMEQNVGKMLPGKLAVILHAFYRDTLQPQLRAEIPEAFHDRVCPDMSERVFLKHIQFCSRDPEVFKGFMLQRCQQLAYRLGQQFEYNLRQMNEESESGETGVHTEVDKTIANLFFKTTNTVIAIHNWKTDNKRNGGGRGSRSALSSTKGDDGATASSSTETVLGGAPIFHNTGSPLE